MKHGRLSLRLDEEFLKEVKKTAKANGVTVTYLIEALLRKFIKETSEHQDEYKVPQA